MSDTTKDPKALDPQKLDERLEVIRSALKSSVRAMFSSGRRDGLRADEVEALQQGLAALGWVPPDALR